jgi:hypothetical protein
MKTKPPLGLIPSDHSQALRDRFKQVQDAIHRYLSHEEYIEIPVEWIKEHNTLCRLLKVKPLK